MYILLAIHITYIILYRHTNKNMKSSRNISTHSDVRIDSNPAYATAAQLREGE